MTNATKAAPREPTEAMLIAARDWSYKAFGKPIGSDAATGCWQAMFDALPAETPGHGEALRTAREDEAVYFVFDKLAKALGLDRWTPEDGSETWDGDVSATLYRILRESGAIDPETDEPIAKRALAIIDAATPAPDERRSAAERSPFIEGAITDHYEAAPPKPPAVKETLP